MFERPELLLLLTLLVPILLMLRSSSRRMRAILRYFDDRGLPRARFILRALKPVTLALIVLAAATPVTKHVVKEKVPIEEAQLLNGKRVLLILLVDVSKSMLGRIDRVKSVLMGMDFPNTTVHLAAFSGKVTPVYTGPAEGLPRVVLSLKAGERYTAIGDALAYAKAFAESFPLPSAVVIFSDGRQNYGSDPLEVAKGYEVPLIIVSVDEVNVLGAIASLAHGKMYSLDNFNIDYREFARKLALRSRYMALEGAGQAFVQREVVSYIPTILTLALSIAAFVASQGDGL